MVVASVEPSTFLSLGLEMMGKEGTVMSEDGPEEIFITNFGTTPAIMSEIWSLLYCKTNFLTEMEPKTKPKFFLWAFAKLKVYEAENIMTSLVKTSKGRAPYGKTFREKTWDLIAAIASLTDDVVRTVSCTCYSHSFLCLLLLLNIYVLPSSSLNRLHQTGNLGLMASLTA